MRLFLPDKPRFTPEQLDRFANIFDNAGQVFLGVLVLTPLVGGIDRANIWVLVLGAIDVFACWAGSILLTRKREVVK